MLWKNVDEPQWGGHRVEPMIDAYKLIRKLDSNHPVGLTQASRGTVKQLKPYNAAADILLLDIYILACKREGKTVEVEFSGLPDWIGRGQVMYESPRTVQAKEGKFTDWFAPFDVHVYCFRRKTK